MRFLAGISLVAALFNSPATAWVESPLDSRVAIAREQIAKNPVQPEGHIALAMALIKVHRATDHPADLAAAQKAIDDALRLAPGDFEAQKAQVAIHLAEGRYRDALSEAQALNRKVPDDNQLYGLIADADIALGDYAAAEKAGQWMIDQRAVNAPGLQRGAALREIFGYNEAALDWWSSSMRLTSASDVEERAWILCRMSRVMLRMGNGAGAEKQAREALNLYPNYPWAQDALAAALMEQERAAEAADILEQRLTAAPSLKAQYQLSKALEIAGKSGAEAAAQKFEKAAIESGKANRELIEYYALHGKAAEAVRIAAKEAEQSPDIDTLAAYARALEKNGMFGEAIIQIERALKPGVRDVEYFYLAGTIAAKLNDKVEAVNYLKKAIELNASSPEAGRAIKLLAGLS